MAQGSPDNHPSIIEGGCLCGSIRYNLHFSYGSAWPPAPHDCQCTQCRKWTGSLVCNWVGVKPSQITWPSSKRPEAATSSPEGLQNYAQFSSSPGCYRAFCNNCGSTILWRCDKEPEEVGITTGTIDEKWLIGEKTGSNGSHPVRESSESGRALCEPLAGHLWFENAIKGATDQVTVGRKFLEGFDGPVLE